MNYQSWTCNSTQEWSGKIHIIVAFVVWQLQNYPPNSAIVLPTSSMVTGMSLLLIFMFFVFIELIRISDLFICFRNQIKKVFRSPSIWGILNWGYTLASSIKLNGVSVALLKRVKPPEVATSRSRFSPAWAPRARPTSWFNEQGVQSVVEKA